MFAMDKTTVLNRAGWAVGLTGGILFGAEVVSGSVFLACAAVAVVLWFLAARVAV
jgi:hypothetical protein